MVLSPAKIVDDRWSGWRGASGDPPVYKKDRLQSVELGISKSSMTLELHLSRSVERNSPSDENGY